MVVEAFNEAFQHGELSASQKQAMISLIAKEGKDLLKLKNYRPIWLLIVDYKILSKVLASRITKVLNEVILEDQLGFMKGRNIGEAICIIDDIFHTSHFDWPGFLIAIDFEKAFDSVAHSFVQEVLSFLVLVHHSENGLIFCIIMHLVVFLTGANLQGTLRSKRGLDKVILCHPIFSFYV